MKWMVALALMTGPALAAPAPGGSWDWQLSDPIKPPNVAVFDTDPDAVTADEIRRLNAQGVYTVCYVSVGTWENWRTDRAAFPPAVIGNTYGDWPDEKFLDVRQVSTLLPLMKTRFARCKAMGFRAIEPDNMDVHDNASGFAITAAHSVRYIKALAKMAHQMGLEIGQKNVPALTGQLRAHMDFAITESCYQDGWCAEVAAYTTAGKPVFDAEYSDRKLNIKKACKTAAAWGISMIVKTRDLTRWRKACRE